MTHHEDKARDHLDAAKDEVKAAAHVIGENIKNSTDHKIESAKDKTKDAVAHASSALINAVDEIHETDAIPAK